VRYEMGMGGRGECRVLAVYGSESGNAKRGITKVAKKIQSDVGLNVVEVVEGNSISSDLTALAAKCEVLVVATSSFGEGDPPENFNLFLLSLYKAAAAGEKPLAGLQHVVLGYGASCYETFQNTPRLADKLLGECGSRRLAKRGELDEGGEEDPIDALKKWEEATFKALKALPAADAPPVCDWTEPGSKILEKSEADLLMGMSAEGGAGLMVKLAGAAVVVAAGVGYAMYGM